MNYEGIRKLVKKQLPRGEESLGIINKEKNIKIDVKDKFVGLSFEKGSKYVIKTLAKFDNNKKMGRLIHMRKASVGASSKNNIHPIKINEGVFIVQNGTMETIMNWAKIELEDFDLSRNDTYYIGKYLMRAKTKNKKKIIEKIKRLSSIDSLGIVFLLLDDVLIFFSDGSRKCYIDEKNNKIRQISNLTLTDKEYETKGWIIFNINDGTIIDKEYTCNEKKQNNYYYGYNNYNNNNGYNYYNKKILCNYGDSFQGSLFTPSKKKIKKLKSVVDFIETKTLALSIEQNGFIRTKKAITNIASYNFTDANVKRIFKNVINGKDSSFSSIEFLDFFIDERPSMEDVENILYYNNI